MERVTGLEPARSVWKTEMLPLNITPARCPIPLSPPRGRAACLPSVSNRDHWFFTPERCQLRFKKALVRPLCMADLAVCTRTGLQLVELLTTTFSPQARVLSVTTLVGSVVPLLCEQLLLSVLVRHGFDSTLLLEPMQVGEAGLEPATLRFRTKRATNCATPRYIGNPLVL